MKLLQKLLGYYTAIDGFLESERQTAQDDTNLESKVEERQRINDQAYFLLCWGQLETELDNCCRNAIRKRKDNPDWTKRRGWDLYNPDEKRLSGISFEERVSLVLDRMAGEFGRAMHWYHLRNRIAHGGSYENRIDLNAVMAEFYQIQRKIAE